MRSITSRKIGVMGGTFDPIHYGHLVAASEASHELNLDEVIFVPTSIPSHKKEHEITKAEDRYIMTVLATASNPLFSVSRVDIDRPGITYTVDTLTKLKEIYSEDELFFITGADALNSIFSWHQQEQLFKLAKFVGVTRPGYKINYENLELVSDKYNNPVTILEVPALAISSTDCRKRISKLRPVWYLMPDEVVRYIDKNKIYR